jgi:AAA+ ATPase superfamily predicted ATPase
MLNDIMRFLDRKDEMGRLDRLAGRRVAGLVVLYGRRRIGKTRLLLEWCARHGGVYTVADQSSPELQRTYFAAAVSRRLPGFADLTFRDWRGLLSRLAREAAGARWRGPLVFDELPYLVGTSPELPSVLQSWVDHEAREAGLLVAVAGSSQRMMQGLVLSADAPLYGRADEVLKLEPLEPRYLRDALGTRSSVGVVESFAAWGGVPRYWELAATLKGSARSRVERLVLDPMGPLHREPDRLLLEEIPSALDVRPVLDAIGAGAHRVSEIAGRVGRPATSMSRPLERLLGLGLARREVPFGESEKKGRRSLYKVNDPFFRLWFGTVAPHRAELAAGSRQTRSALLARFWNGLVAQSWEDICRVGVPRLRSPSTLARLGPWGPAARWWKGNEPEWDIVAESIGGKRLLLGEVKWSARPQSARDLESLTRQLETRRPPSLPGRYSKHEIVRALFVPEVGPRARRRAQGPPVVTGSDLLG